MTQKINITSLWVFLLFFLFRGNVLSQTKQPQPQFIHYSIEQGLPSSETYFVHQDKKGYMWFCTDRGVVRFDGYRYKTYTTKDGLFSNVVFKVYEDLEGRIWFLSMSNKLCYLENDEIKPYKYNNLIDKLFSITDTPTKKIAINKNGQLFISLFNRGGYQINSNGTYKELTNKNNHEIYFKDLNHEIFSVTSVNLDSLGFIKTPIYINNNLSKSILWDAKFILSTKEKNNSFYVINNDIFTNNLNKIRLDIENQIIYSIKPLNNQNLAIGTNNGVLILKKSNDTLIKQNHFLQNNTVTSISKDIENNLWFSTLENGIFQAININVQNITKIEGLKKENISSINGYKTNIIIGINNYGWLQLSPPFLKKTTHLKVSPKISIQNNKVSISSNHLYEIKGNSIKTVIKNNWFRSIYHHNKSTYLCSDKILQLKNNIIDTLYDGLHDTSKNKQVRLEAILIDYKNRLLTGNSNGLIEIKQNKATQENFKHPLFKTRIIDLKHSKTLKNIAATRGKGIYFFKDSIIIDSIRKENGLLSNDINSIYIDSKDRLWVCSNKGLNLITKLKGKYKIEQFTTKNGLISNEINEVYEYNNKVWCATKKGVSIIDLNSFKRSYIKFPLHLEKVILKSKTYTSFEKRTFPYNEEFVKILFRSSNFKNSTSPNYAYRTSKKAKWQYINTPEIIFNQPSSNEYQIEVKSLNEDGKWSSPQLLYSFEVDLPFYYKWYSIALGIVFIIIIMFSIFKYRLYQINQKNNLQKQIKKLESKALRAQMNPHFIFNALNSIQSFLVYEENEKAEKYLVKFAYLIRQTLNNSRKTVISIEDEINILNRYLELEQMRFKDKFTFNVYNNIKEKDIHLKIPPMMIQPYVENAILHAFKKIELGGVINITFAPLEGNKLTCTIEDNGIGINNSLNENKSNHQSLGTTITQERLSFFSKKKTEHFNILSKQGSQWGDEIGTTIIIEIPIFKSDEEF